MASLVFGVFYVLLAATGIFYLVKALALRGNPVAEDIRFPGGALCQYPGFLAVAAGGAGLS
jgi:hypothetical protein